MKIDRAAILSDFGNALATLVSAALQDLGAEKLRAVSEALSSGRAKIQLAIDTSPELVVVAYLRTPDCTGPMHELFRIVGGSPSASAH